ncbi:MAG: 4Fe-4S dicluster domain-containing protein [Spartobacteria bacterium]|nr:4Fe-4S dicluster domain-containing protein [Spartobacteria bacterium]
MTTDTDKQVPFPVIHELECKACGRCVAACPKDVLYMGTDFNDRGYHYVKYKGEGCIGCGNCYYTCPEPSALEVHIPGKKGPDGQQD